MKKSLASYLMVPIFAGASLLILSLIYCPRAFARTEVKEGGQEEREIEQDRSPKVGEAAARKFFRKPASENASSSSSSSGTDWSSEHYLAVHLGSFISSDSYQWGQNPHQTSVGRLNLGLTYRLGSMGSLADTAIRADFLGFSLPEGNPIQVAFLPMILLPEASSKFPLFFGLGLGPGFFFNQISQESFLSVNYQLVAGARFFNVLQSTGFFIEGGLKNGFLLLTDGQYLGYFLAIGAVFAF